MKKQSFKKSLLIFLLILSIILLASCSKSTDKGYSDNKAPEAEMGGSELEDTVGTNGLTSEKLPKEAKIIRTVDLEGETKDFQKASKALRKNLSDAGGYIEKSEITGGKNLYGGSSAQRATYIFRIPAEKLDSFLAQTEGLLNITSTIENTTDVTLEYYDIEARLNTLKAKKTALEAMLEKATTIDEILLIQDNLYSVISDIEAYQSQLNAYDSKVDYATVTLTLNEVIEYTETEDPKFIDRIADAFVETWQNFGDFIQDMAVVLVYCMPFFVFLAVLAIIIFVIVMIAKRKIKKKKNDEK